MNTPSPHGRSHPAKARTFVSFLRIFGPLILFGALLLGVIPGRFALTEVGAPMHWLTRYVGIPGTLVIVGVGLALRREFLARSKFKINFWIFLVMGPAVLVYAGAGAATAANMLLPPQTQFLLSGTVVQMDVTHGRRSTWWTLRVETDSGTREISVTQDVYAGARVGRPFNQERTMGPLGFSYTRR